MNSRFIIVFISNDIYDYFQNDAKAASMLMKKLTRRANNRTPSLTTSEWTQLQSDMAALQSKVYRCIDKYTCCEVCLWWCCYQRVKIDFIYDDIKCYNKISTFAPHRGGFKCMLILNLIPTHIQPYLLFFIVVLMTIYKKKTAKFCPLLWAMSVF